MSLKLSFASISVGASVDQQTGNLSVFDVIDEVRTPQLPVHLQSLVLTVVLDKQTPLDYRGKIFIHLIPPDGKQAIVGNGELQIPIDQRKLKAVFRFGGFPLLAFGMHRFVISWTNIGGVKEGEAILDFDVVEVKADQGKVPDESGPKKPPMSH